MENQECKKYIKETFTRIFNFYKKKASKWIIIEIGKLNIF